MGILIAAIALAAVQSGVDPVPPASEHRLTPQQIESVLADAEAKRKASESRATASIEIADLKPLPKPQLHGEFGVSAGTGGYREIFGTGIYPLGNDGGAAFSFDFIDFGNRSHRRDHIRPRDRY